MPTVTEAIDVDVPVTTAYSQWTQFESFPQFRNTGRPDGAWRGTVVDGEAEK